MKRILDLLRPGLAELWFGRNDPRHLAIARILVFGHMFLYRTGNNARFLELKEVAWYPIALFQDGGLPVLSVGAVRVMQDAFVGLTLLAMLGVGFRLVAPLTAAVHLYLFAIPNCFGKVNHDNAIVIVSIILAFSCASDAWSFDAWLRRKVKRDAPRRLEGAYRWPLTMMALTVCIVYGAAGWTKLDKTGLEWAWSDSFSRYLLRHHFTHQPVIMFGVVLASFTTLCKLLASVALAIEVSIPLAVLHRRLYPVLLLGAACMQLSIWLLFGVFFRMMIPVFLALLPWGRILSLLERRLPMLERFLRSGGDA